jgi:hypothetical protein
VKKRRTLGVLTVAIAVGLAGGVFVSKMAAEDDDHHSLHFRFEEGSLVLRRSVYVGAPGVLPTGSTADLAAVPITVLPGFPTTLASGTALDGSTGNSVAFPFGLWFADEKTLYVCDEGDGTLVTPAVNGNVVNAVTLATAGVQKWSLVDGTWKLLYVLQDYLRGDFDGKR